MATSAGIAFYANAITKATLLIEKFGRNIRVIHEVPSTPSDPTQPWLENPPTITNVDTIGVFTQFARKLVDGTTIKRTDKKLIFVATGIDWDISTSDLIQEGTPDNLGQQYIVCDVLQIVPGPISVLYELQVRIG